MADTVLSGRWVVYYSAENRQKRIVRDTSVSATTTDTVNALYSALQDLFDELPQMDDGVPMSAQTPTEYTIGIIDAGDKDPWFIDRTSVEYLTGGALKTASWDRTTTNTGIVRIAYTIGTDFDVTDIGRDVLHDGAEADRGTILDFNTTGSIKYVWVRPDSFAATNDFDSVAGTLTVQNDSISQVQRYDDSLTAFGTDETVDANDTGNADWTIFPDPGSATNDYVAIGYSQKFRKVIFDNLNGTAGTVGVVLWEFWNGSAWADLEAVAGFTDGTSDFKAAAADGQTLSWTGTPTNWATTSLNGSPQLYYIRARVTTAYTANPVYDQGFIGATGSVTQSGASVSGGESLWANIYSIGTIESNTHIYIYQNGAYLNAYKGTSDWWGENATTGSGHIDILVNVKELGVESDEGYITVMARQYSKTYSYYIVDLTNGGRNPIPLQTGKDLDNQTGYRQLTGSSGVVTFEVGNYIYAPAAGGWSAATKKGVITAVGGTGAAPILSYYLIGEPITDFVDTNTVKEYTGTADGDASCTVNGAPVNIGAALDDATYALTATHAANTTFDVDENGTTENYSIVIACDSRPLADVYQWAKWITRRGETSHDSDTDGVNGEYYIGSDYRLRLTGEFTGTVNEGDTVTQAGTGAKGTIVAKNSTASPKIVILRNSRGTFNTTGLVTGNQGGTFTPDSAVAPITPIAAAPFGTFAGGKWFCAPGVYLDGRLSADLNNFQLVDDTGTVRVAPTKVNITVGNTKTSDKIAVFRLTAEAGDIEKNYYACVGGESAGGTSLVVTPSLRVDEPGKASPGGVLRLVDSSANTEYRMRFTSWATATFTLASQTGLTADATGCTATVLKDTEATFTTWGIKVGDLLRNTTESKIAYVVSVDSQTQLTTTAVTDWTSDAYQINTLPVAPEATNDKVYVPFIDAYETADGSETVQIVYNTTVYTRVRARRSGSLSNRILPFEQDSSIGTSGMNVSVIRTLDTIVT